MTVNVKSDGDTGKIARALWFLAAGRAALREESLPAPRDGEVLVRARASALSRGTERLVFEGRVPPNLFADMRAPFQDGDFAFPVKYGYCSVGVVEAGAADWLGRRVFCLHPHQDFYVAPVAALRPIPDGIPDARATLAANLETALNALWDSGAGPGDRIGVIGAGLVGLLVAALAAGNRVMLKPSELTPRTAETLAEMLGGLFSEEEVAVVLGGPEIGAAFCGLPFDHLLFTGSTQVGRKVLTATAANLTPTTLELGGKSPCVIAPGADLAQAAARIATGKLLNAGQTCIAPDYVLLPAENRQVFVQNFVEAVKRLYPSLLANTDYTCVISESHYARLMRMIEQARQSGAEIVAIDPVSENPPSPSRKLPPTLVLDPAPDLTVMTEEIFGPILPVLGYQTFASALDFINARGKPLALYYFGPEDRHLQKLLASVDAGGVTVNETMSHFGAENLPFGGVGPSGMGAYHGEAGFRAFSHAKPVLLQSRLDSRILLRPPYGKLAEALLRFMLRG